MDLSTSKGGNEILDSIIASTHTFDECTYVHEYLLSPGVLLSNDPFPSVTDFHLDKVHAAPYGGIVVAYHDVAQIPGIPLLHVYDSCLHRRCSFDISPYAPVVDFYVTPEEMIVVFYQNCFMEVYDQRGYLIVSRQFLENLDDCRIVAFSEFGAFFLSGIKVYWVTSYSTLEFKEFSEIVEGAHSVTLLVATPGPRLWAYSDGQLLCVDPDATQPVPCSSEVRSISFSANYKLVALVCDDIVVIGGGDFEATFAQFPLRGDLIYHSGWVGSSSFLIATDTRVILLGSSAATLRWDFPGGALIATEIDGARVIGRDRVALIRHCENPAAVAFLNRSSTPTFTFFKTVTDAANFAREDPVERFGRQIEEILDNCLLAATFFRDQNFISTLLGFVSKYKVHAANYDTTRYREVLQTQRVLLQLSELHCPMTHAQLEGLGFDRLLIRLCNRYMHFLAVRIADYLRLPVDDVAVNWGQCLIRSKKLSTAEIVSKLSHAKCSVDLVMLANAAYDLAEGARGEERRRLQDVAKALLAGVKVKARSVPNYVKRREWPEALRTAVESNDVSLMGFALGRAAASGENEVVRDCIAESKEAREVWAQMRPGDVEVAGYRLALVDRFLAGTPAPDLQKEVKTKDDPLSEAATDLYANVAAACRLLEIAYDFTLTPFKLIDMALGKTALPPKERVGIAGQIAKLFKLSDGELTVRKIEFAARGKDLKYMEVLVSNVSSKSDAGLIADLALHFTGRGRVAEAKLIHGVLVTKFPDLRKVEDLTRVIESIRT
jgi:hypothetical protein